MGTKDYNERGRSLTRHEFDAVIRRAAELASSDSESREGALSEAELFRIAGEVGLNETHVRMALSEVRAGGVPGGALDRIFGPSQLRALRVVPGQPEALGGKLDDFLAGTQLLQPVRRTANKLHYRPALDWASQLARAASLTSRKYYVASAKSVEVHLEALDDSSTLVELLVDPGTRGDNVVGAVFGGGLAGLAVGGGLAFAVVASGGILGLAVPMGLVGGGALTTGITYLVGTSHKRKVMEVQAELEGILDRLETGESLEPPPASWRRWVKRQFHGVAHELMSREEDPDEREP